MRRSSMKETPVEGPFSVDSASHREGGFTAAELETLRAAFAHGAKGSLLVGLRRRRRLLTALLPPQPTQDAAALQMLRAAARLRALRCDGYLHARRARLSGTPPLWVVVEERVEGIATQRLLPVEGGAPHPTVRGERRLRDRVTQALEAAFEEAPPVPEPK